MQDNSTVALHIQYKGPYWGVKSKKVLGDMKLKADRTVLLSLLSPQITCWTRVFRTGYGSHSCKEKFSCNLAESCANKFPSCFTCTVHCDGFILIINPSWHAKFPVYRNLIYWEWLPMENIYRAHTHILFNVCSCRCKINPVILINKFSPSLPERI